MLIIGILGDIGSGKSFVAKNFGYPVFNADSEVSNIYKKDIKVFKELKKKLPNHIVSFPINKKEILSAILFNKINLSKIVKIVHKEVKKKMISFLKKNRLKKIVILDIPLLLENRIDRRVDILVYVDAKKSEILKRLKSRKNYNKSLLKRFYKIQMPLKYKKKKAHFIIKNKFTKKSIKFGIKNILSKI